jgi:hypothetical protein
MNTTVRAIAQLLLTTTNAVSLTVLEKRRLIIKSVTICNSDASNAVSFNLWVNVAGSTLDDNCALFKGCLVPAASTMLVEWESGFGFGKSSDGLIGAQASAANALTFSVMAVEY